MSTKVYINIEADSAAEARQAMSDFLSPFNMQVAHIGSISSETSESVTIDPNKVDVVIDKREPAPTKEAPKKRGPKPKAKAEPEPAIRANPENREPPADEQDDAATQAQDDEDEKPVDPGPSSSADDADGLFDDDAKAAPEPKLDAMDVRNSIGRLLARRGGDPSSQEPEAVKLRQSLVPVKNAIFEKHLGAGKTAMKDLEGVDQAKLRAIVADLDKAK